MVLKSHTHTVPEVLEVALEMVLEFLEMVLSVLEEVLEVVLEVLEPLPFSSSSLSLLEAAGSEEEEESMMVRPGRLLLVLAVESVAGRSGFIPMPMRQVQNARIGSTKSRN